jgi:predicted MFS family arabinose efflux permease
LAFRLQQWLGCLVLAWSLIQTPSGLLLTRSCDKDDRPAVFAAHFTLTHACWLLAYPLTGVIGAQLELSTAFLLAAIITALGLVAALKIWPASDPSGLAKE